MEQRGYETPAWKLQQTDLVYAGLAGVAIVFVQDYVGLPVLDAAATISIIAFAVALPLLAILGVLNAVQAGYRYAPFPWWMTLAVVVALGASAIGIVAAFWHASVVAAIVVTATGMLAGVLTAAYRISLERANAEG
jgi:uncharacterized membrane protein YoaK (UPF0700 family)